MGGARRDLEVSVSVRAGRTRIRVQEGLGMLRAYLDQFWSRSLANFKAAAEQEDS